ncbi:(d)CMP kinase [Paenibacillus yanchengensis]|uniref:Cytidylate kinase n=1 Tax=Paenibacillus yanchengensis TaxID=2035833 RepID=A0ABW4YKL1_9BACL
MRPKLLLWLVLLSAQLMQASLQKGGELSVSQQHSDRDQAGNRINIAIDGPAGAGKSTIARMVAGQLNYIYIDTGAMYRAVTLAAQRAKVASSDEAALEQLLKKIQITLLPGDEGQLVWMNDEDVTGAIRKHEVTEQVSYYAAQRVVREVLSQWQRELAATKGVVMDGRDIGTAVLPSAELKIFLTASVSERASRRFKQLKPHEQMDLETLEKSIATRDELDKQRDISPLVQAEDAILLDSTGKSIDEVVQEVVNLGRCKMAGEN